MTVEMPTISNPGLFTYDPANPTKYTESCSHAIHQVLYALSQAGYEIRDLSDSLGYFDDEEVWHSYLENLSDALGYLDDEEVWHSYLENLSDALGYLDDEEVWHSYLSDFLPPLCDISHIASLMDDVWGDYNIPN